MLGCQAHHTPTYCWDSERGWVSTKFRGHVERCRVRPEGRRLSSPLSTGWTTRRSTASLGTSLASGTSVAVFWSGTAAATLGCMRLRHGCRSGFGLVDRRGTRSHRRPLQRAELPGRRLGRGPPDLPWHLGNAVPLMVCLATTPLTGAVCTGWIAFDQRQIDVEASRWRLQLGATLHF